MKLKLIIPLLFLLGGCALSMTYEEMGDAYETAATPEEKKIAEKRIDQFEEYSRRADLYFEDRARCESDSELMWYCRNTQATDPKKIKTIDAKVRAYKREHYDCQCATEESVMNAFRQAGFY